MQLVDIGANLTHASFDTDADEVVSRARQAGVSRIVVTGTSEEESRKALAFAAARPGLYATAGVHPHHARGWTAASADALRALARDPKIVAIGECGLDFNRNYSPHPAQEECFAGQIELGLALKKPLFLHSRDAHPRFAEILKSSKIELAVAHCFTGERDELRAYLDLGLYIGITGWICDERRGRHLLELVREIPHDRLLLETDAPYLTPRDMRPQPKSRRNEPAFLAHIAKAVARAVGKPVEQLAEETTRNAQTLFRLRESGASTGTQRAARA
jgi:TatD DNase family protein